MNQQANGVKRRHNLARRTFLIAKPGENGSPVRCPVVLHAGQAPEEMERNAWLRSGDIVAKWAEEDDIEAPSRFELKLLPDLFLH
jgi:hypothetical protein